MALVTGRPTLQELYTQVRDPRPQEPPGGEVCVVVDRPEFVRTEAVPGTWYGEARLRRDGVRCRDGWQPHPV